MSIKPISGGFKDWIDQVVCEIGIDSSHVLGNTLMFDSNENIIGYDIFNPLSKSGGKSIVINELPLDGEIIVVGDGYTDYEIKESGTADRFIAFTENVRRENVCEKADFVAKSFDDVINCI